MKEQSTNSSRLHCKILRRINVAQLESHRIRNTHNRDFSKLSKVLHNINWPITQNLPVPNARTIVYCIP